MPRTVTLYQSSFDIRGPHKPLMGARGALVLYTNGLWFYHDGTSWVPTGGFTGPQWIRHFHVATPQFKEDEVGVVIGLYDDTRSLDDAWTHGRVTDALHQFVNERPGEMVWPAGKTIHPFRKARMIASQRPRDLVADAVNATITPTIPGEQAGRNRHTRSARV